MKEIELRDWEHYREYILNNIGGSHRYIFRGHADREWKLESTLTRLGQRVTKTLSASPHFLEQSQLRNFRMKVRGLLGKSPTQLSDNELWALGQHYGLCTPLLDWTESPYIAAYFAFSSASACTSGWRTIFILDMFGMKEKTKNIETDTFEFFEPLQGDNNRIVAQAGLFTKLPTNTDLESWLKEKNLDEFLRKVHIEDDYRLDAINDLKLMNIVGSSIYPDLHGASLSCNMFLETLSDNFHSELAVRELLKKLGPQGDDHEGSDSPSK